MKDQAAVDELIAGAVAVLRSLYPTLPTATVQSAVRAAYGVVRSDPTDDPLAAVMAVVRQARRDLDERLV